MQQNKVTQYFEKNKDLRVLFVFDPVGDILNEIAAFPWDEAAVAGQPPYRVVRFAGDWFVTKCALSQMKDGERCIMLMPMASPLGSEQAMAAFPLLGELCANAFYSDGDYHAFMVERGLPESASYFVRTHLAELQLNKFDKVLGPCYGMDFTSELGHRGVLSVLLGESTVREWREIIVRLFVIDAGSPETEKKRTAFYSTLIGDRRYADELDALQNELKKVFGCELETNKERHMARPAVYLRYNTVVQNLSTNPADNYKSCRVTDGLVIERMRNFLQYATELPEKQRAAFFRAFEELAADIHLDHVAEVYGTDADYGAYPPALCRVLLGRVAKDGVAKKAEAVRNRAQVIAERAEAGVRMRGVAAFLSAAAEFYLARAKVATFTLNSSADYVTRYAEEWCGLDRCYRLAIEKFYAIGNEDDKAIVEAANAALDADYALAASEMNAEWTKSLKKDGGTGGLSVFPRQQDFYKDIGDPSQKHVVIVSDGLRYEVAEEIAKRINSGRHKAILKPGIAMLPSETKYCKPVLLPHERVEFVDCNECDVRLDDRWAVSMDNRREILAWYNPDARCVDTAQLAQMSREDKRALFKQPLVYVYHDVIDSASHGETGKDIVAACRKCVDELAQLISSIHSTYNVADVLVVSDHGFLLNDMLFEDKDKIQIASSENVLEKATRYYLTRSDTAIHGIEKFPLKAVSAMDGDVLVAVPAGTARFAVPGGYAYAHGGAALQEIVIPIIRSQCLRPDAREKVNVSLVDRKLQVVSSLLKVKLLQDEAVTATMQRRTVVCALYAGDKRVTSEKTIVMDSAEADPSARVRIVELTLSESLGTGILQFKAFDKDDLLNPLIQEPVTNKTLVERDF